MFYSKKERNERKVTLENSIFMHQNARSLCTCFYFIYFQLAPFCIPFFTKLYLRIIRVRSWFCPVLVYVNLYFLLIFFGKSRFSSFCVLVFRLSLNFSFEFFCSIFWIQCYLILIHSSKQVLPITYTLEKRVFATFKGLWVVYFKG